MDSQISDPAVKFDWPGALFRGLINLMLMGGLISVAAPSMRENYKVMGAVMVGVALLLMWNFLAAQLDRIESKLSN
jgi:hypothetical protein